MEYITTTIGILGFIGILYGLVKMFRESGHTMEGLSNEDFKEMRGQKHGPLGLDLRNLMNSD